LSWGVGSRRGIVHVIDALVAISVISAVVIGSVFLLVDRLSTRIQAPPDPEGLDAYISERLASGDWIPLIVNGRADLIRQELEDLFQGSPQPPTVSVYIYVMNPGLGHVQEYAASDPGLQSTYTVLRYYVPVGGYHGDLAFILEIRVYWP